MKLFVKICAHMTESLKINVTDRFVKPCKLASTFKRTWIKLNGQLGALPGKYQVLLVQHA